MPAAEVLNLISRYFAANLGLEDEPANEKAVALLFERLASGDLFASPKGFLPQYATEATDIHRWYSLWLTESTGEKIKYQPSTGNDTSHVAIPFEFWRPFQRCDAGAASDWDAGDFRIDNVCDSDGAWSGRVRDVHFDRIDLPASWLAQVQPSLSKVEGQVSEESRDSPSDTVKSTLPSFATKSDRLHEAAAHEAAKFVRETRCPRAEAIRQVRKLVEAKGRQKDSIDRAIRKSYELMYDAHGLPIQN
ncbi:hypothetical protein [Parasphingorhabdus sp.]|uniref:hypothetical protein n=1 Tax=Parasphingorhabdus sp. TaxID=2709688 RepID=UPI0039E4060D